MSNTAIIGNVELHLCDCMDYMRELPDKAFELAIVDPPYGIGVAKHGTVNGGSGKAAVKKYKNVEWDNNIPDSDYFNELFRVSENQIIWGGNYFCLPGTSGMIVWKKMDINNDFNPMEIAWTSNLKGRMFDYLWAGMWQEDMKNKEQRIHPTQKPVKLYEWLLTNYAKEGDRILDTHLGSGSSAIACNNLGFSMVGCELDPDYFAAACERITNAQRQKKLFA